jgi:hypothetical protein
MKNPINLEHTVEEINLILTALAAKPYAEVAELIHRIKIDAEEQLANASKVNESEPPNE